MWKSAALHSLFIAFWAGVIGFGMYDENLGCKSIIILFIWEFGAAAAFISLIIALSFGSSSPGKRIMFVSGFLVNAGSYVVWVLASRWFGPSVAQVVLPLGWPILMTMVIFRRRA